MKKTREKEIRLYAEGFTQDTELKSKFSGWAARYDSESQYMGWIEVLRSSIFSKTLQESRNIVATYNHDENALLATTKAGTLRLENRAEGLWFELDIPDTTLGRDTLTLVERGDLFGCSFTMYVIQDDWSWDDQGIPYRSITEAKLTEIAIVNNPAFLETEVEARNMPSEMAEAVQRKITGQAPEPVQPNPDYTLLKLELDLLEINL